MGESKKALEFYETAIFFNSENVYAWNDKGTALRILGKYDESLECFKKAIELKPSLAIANISLAAIYRKIGRETEFAEACKSAHDLIEKESVYNRACFEAVCGSPDAALELLRTALEKKQETADWARRDPDFEFIRDDHRFKALLDEFSEDGEKGPE
jgi:tetratricopeptide (TPR) repeat protein